MDCARRLRGHSGAVLGVRYTSDGAYCMSCGADRKVLLWNPARPAEKTGAMVIKEYSGPHSKEVTAVAIAKDSARFASCGADAKALVWDVGTGAVVRRLEGHGSRVNDVAFAAVDGCVLATASYDNTARLWDLRSQSRHAIQVLDDFKDSVTGLAVARDDGKDYGIATSSVDGAVRTFDLRRGLVHTDSFETPVTAVALSGDGACLAASCLDSSLRLLELQGGAQLNLYKGHDHASFALEACFSNDDAHVASCSEDGRVLVWHLVEASLAFELRDAHRQATSSISWHPKRAAALVASFDGTISLWEQHRG